MPWNEITALQKHIDGVLMGDAIPQIGIQTLIDFWQEGEFPFDKLEKFYTFDQVNEANKASNDGSVIKPVMVIDQDYVPGQ